MPLRTILLSLFIGPTLTFAADLKFEGSISREVLDRYLARSVTHVGLLSSSADPATKDFEKDLAMLQKIGAKFVGRAAFVWDMPPDDEAHFEMTRIRAARVHQADPEMILQAAIFETVTTRVNDIAIPAWVFEEMGNPIEKRNFRYQKMLYPDGRGHNRWRGGASVPDLSQLEARLWFYYRARRYLDCGIEAIHFGQVKIMDDDDPGHRHWIDLLTRVRNYAKKHARRKLVLCDAHTHGISEEERLLFDFHSYPMRLREIKDQPMKVALKSDDPGDIFTRSLGGISPSGWKCDKLPYLVEFDNYGYSGRGGKSVGGIWVWGYDEISWFGHLDEPQRKTWLKEASAWIGKNAPHGHLQMPTRRLLAAPVSGQAMFHAGEFGIVETISEIWKTAPPGKGEAEE